MIRKKTVFILIPLILIILAVLISIPDTKKKSDGRIVLADFIAEEIKSIEFNNEEGSWKLINDGGFFVAGNRKTDETAVNLLVGDLLCFDGKIIAKQSNNDIYGIAKASTSVIYTMQNGDQVAFYVGNKTPPGTEYYLSDESGRIYTVYSETGDALKSKRYQLEDSFILGIDYENIEKFEVYGKIPFSLIKQNNVWKMVCDGIEKEIPTDIIKQKVTRHFGGMYSLKTVENTKSNGKLYELDKTDDAVILYDTMGQKYVINIGKTNNGHVYVTVNNSDVIYCVIDDCFEFIKLFREEVY